MYAMSFPHAKFHPNQGQGEILTFALALGSDRHGPGLPDGQESMRYRVGVAATIEKFYSASIDFRLLDATWTLIEGHSR